MSSVGSMLSTTVVGDITPEEVADALRRYFVGRKVIVDRDGFKKPEPNTTDLLVAPTPTNETIEDLKNLLEWKEREMKEMEASSAKALNSIQTFHQQQQALFDEFVLLRQRYDEQKLALLNILWIQCGQFHPDLKQIPNCKDVHTYVENDERVGDYTVGEMLGEGQFAMVKSCWKDGGDEYAIKIIKKERITTFTSLKRVSNEIEILRRLKSEFIVSVKEVIQTQTKLYIITEKGGADLFEFFDEHPDGVPEPWAKDIITCVLKAVLYCHDQGICHRDLKPENILLVFDYETHKCVDLKLCDFGLSTRFSSKITLTDFCGSPGFFAPEMIITGQYYGDKADVWSTGCILLELVLGHERFCDVWMTAYDYEVLQSKERFTHEIGETVRRLPAALSCSDALNDFAMKFLKLNTLERPMTRAICMHPWLEGAFEAIPPITPKAGPGPRTSSLHSMSNTAGGYMNEPSGVVGAGGGGMDSRTGALPAAGGGAAFSALSQALNGLALAQGLAGPGGSRRVAPVESQQQSSRPRPMSPARYSGARPSMDSGSLVSSPLGGGHGGGHIDPAQLNARFMGLGAKERALMEDYLHANSEDDDSAPRSGGGGGQVHLPRIDTITPKLLNAALLKKGLEEVREPDKSSTRGADTFTLGSSASMPHFSNSSGSGVVSGGSRGGSGQKSSPRSSSDHPVGGTKQSVHYSSPRGSRETGPRPSSESQSFAAWMPTPRAPDEPFQSSGAAPRNLGSYYRGLGQVSSPINVSMASLPTASTEDSDRDTADDSTQIEDLRSVLQANMFGLSSSDKSKDQSRRPARSGSPF